MRRRTIHSTIGIVAAATLLAACGGDDNADPTTTTATTATATTAVPDTTDGDPPDTTVPETTTTPPTTAVTTTTPDTTTTSPPTTDLPEGAGDHASVAVEVGAAAIPDGYRLSVSADEAIALLGLEAFPQITDEPADLLTVSRAVSSEGAVHTGAGYRVAVPGDHLDILEPFQAEFAALGAGNDQWTTDIVPGDEDGMHVLRVTSPLFGDLHEPVTYQVRTLLLEDGLLEDGLLEDGTDHGNEYRVTILRSESPDRPPEMPATVATLLGSEITTADEAGFAPAGWDLFTFVEPSGPDSLLEVREMGYSFDTGGIDPDDFTAIVEAASPAGVEPQTPSAPNVEVLLLAGDATWVLFDDGTGEVYLRQES